jgi:hypothetical protein
MQSAVRTTAAAAAAAMAAAVTTSSPMSNETALLQFKDSGSNIVG